MFFYIPFCYLFKTRLLSKSARLAWFFTYIIPTLIVYYYIIHDDFVFYFLILLTTFSAYELGYIYNDAELIKKESSPTLRLTQLEHIFYEKNKFNIYASRLMWLVASNLIVNWLYVEYFIFVLLNSLSILMVYVVYNSIRNEFNIILYSFLLMFKYFGVYVFLVFQVEFILISWILYPLCNTLDFATKPRFFTSRHIKIDDFDKFRVKYYVLVALFIYILNHFYHLSFFDVFNALALYFLVYRTVLYLSFVRKFRQ